MKHMFEQPTRVWILAQDESEPRLLPADEAAKVFDKYEDTGFEPKLRFLYESIDCHTVDVRDLPGLGHLWFDDNGRLDKRPLSGVASALYEYCYRNGEGIVGRAVLVVYPDCPEGADQEVVMTSYNEIQKAKRGLN